MNNELSVFLSTLVLSLLALLGVLWLTAELANSIDREIRGVLRVPMEQQQSDPEQ